jgi:hypothetical protein
MVRPVRHAKGGPFGPEIDEWQEFALLEATRGTGATSLRGAFGESWEYLIEELWEIHGERLTDRWLKKYPGGRPSLWWAFTAREPRRIICPFPDPDTGARLVEENSFGGGILAHPMNVRHAGGWWLMDSAAHLAELGELTDDEREILSGRKNQENRRISGHKQ